MGEDSQSTVDIIYQPRSLGKDAGKLNHLAGMGLASSPLLSIEK